SAVMRDARLRLHLETRVQLLHAIRTNKLSDRYEKAFSQRAAAEVGASIDIGNRLPQQPEAELGQRRSGEDVVARYVRNAAHAHFPPAAALRGAAGRIPL